MTSRLKLFKVDIYAKTAGNYLFSSQRFQAATSESARKKAEQYLWKQGRLARFYSIVVFELNYK